MAGASGNSLKGWAGVEADLFVMTGSRAGRMRATRPFGRSGVDADDAGAIVSAFRDFSGCARSHPRACRVTTTKSGRFGSARHSGDNRNSIRALIGELIKPQIGAQIDNARAREFRGGPRFDRTGARKFHRFARN